MESRSAESGRHGEAVHGDCRPEAASPALPRQPGRRPTAPRRALRRRRTILASTGCDDLPARVGYNSTISTFQTAPARMWKRVIVRPFAVTPMHNRRTIGRGIVEFGRRRKREGTRRRTGQPVGCGEAASVEERAPPAGRAGRHGRPGTPPPPPGACARVAALDGARSFALGGEYPAQRFRRHSGHPTRRSRQHVCQGETSG